MKANSCTEENHHLGHGLRSAESLKWLTWLWHTSELDHKDKLD
jgi:hypothetical protein